MQHLYALAAELNVPITIHFQEVNQPGSPGTYNRGLKQFDAMLKVFPKTTFIGHADAFWPMSAPIMPRTRRIRKAPSSPAE